MFDSAPPNLPVEPAPKAPQMPPAPLPQQPTQPIAQQPVVVGQMKKEPEDIFQDLDAANEVPDKALVPEYAAAPSGPPLKLIGLIVGGLVVLGGFGFAAWFFLGKPKATVEEVLPEAVQTPVEQIETPPPASQPPVTAPPPGANIPAPESIAKPPEPAATDTIQVPTAQPAAEPAVAANSAPVEGADADQDMLTDAEEALLGTDPASKDSNSNTYADGIEVGNLYDPLVKGSPLEKSAKLKWLEWESIRVLAPTGWSIMTDPLRPGVAIVDTGTAARFTLLQKKNDLGNLSLRGWLALPDTDKSMKPLKPKAGWEALQTADGLTTYVAVNGTIVIMAYELNGAPAYDLRSLFALLANSLQTVK